MNKWLKPPKLQPHMSSRERDYLKSTFIGELLRRRVSLLMTHTTLSLSMTRTACLFVRITSNWTHFLKSSNFHALLLLHRDDTQDIQTNKRKHCQAGSRLRLYNNEIVQLEDVRGKASNPELVHS